MTAYPSKSEIETPDLLKQAAREVKNKNLFVREVMIRFMHSFIRTLQMSLQKACYVLPEL